MGKTTKNQKKMKLLLLFLIIVPLISCETKLCKFAGRHVSNHYCKEWAKHHGYTNTWSTWVCYHKWHWVNNYCRRPNGTYDLMSEFNPQVSHNDLLLPFAAGALIGAGLMALYHAKNKNHKW